ncbi:MAG: PDZ domain-containing protein [Planctomycetes bacterium]|nr:PDZ domain-containing protein [Planctomycetota bacterium]MCW8135966.1 PDZ domain-containing protein [Planctomycetota bacterium]
MKTILTALAAIALFACTSVAQDVPPEPKIDAVDMLQKYLKAEGKERESLRKQLIDLGYGRVRAAIRALPYTNPGTTEVIKRYTECPDGFKRPYWVWPPENYDPGQAYGLFVVMHGGVSGWPLEGDAARPSVGEYSGVQFHGALPDELRGKVAVLSCSAGVPDTHETAAWWHLNGQRNVLHMIAQAKALLNIDDDKVIVTGMSDGGSGTFAFAYRMPDTFAGFYAAIGHPLVAAADGTPVWLENLKGSNIYAFNGGVDRLYPSAQMIPIYEQANAAGANIKVKDYPKLGHEIASVLEDELKNFAKEFWSNWTRDLLPREVDWTSTSPARGGRAWLHIREIANYGGADAAIPNVEIKTPGARVRLGVQLEQDSSPPKVETVVAGSVAERIGVKQGDVIIKLDSKEIKKFDDLVNALGEKSPGDEVTLVVRRGKDEHALKGRFPRAERPSAEAPVEARVIGTQQGGAVNIKVRNVSKLAIRIHPDMITKDGSLRVTLEGAKDKTATVSLTAIKGDPAWLLQQFEATRDRKQPFICEVEIDVARALALKVAGKKPPAQEEDEF